MKWWWQLPQCSARIGGAGSGCSGGGGSKGELLQLQRRLTHSCRTFHDPQQGPSINCRQRLHFSTAHCPHYTARATPYTRTRPPSRTDTTILPLSRVFFRAVRPRLAAPTPSITPLRRLYSHSTMAQVKWPAAEVRKTFFDFFEEKGHTLGELPLNSYASHYELTTRS